MKLLVFFIVLMIVILLQFDEIVGKSAKGSKGSTTSTGTSGSTGTGTSGSTGTVTSGSTGTGKSGTTGTGKSGTTGTGKSGTTGTGKSGTTGTGKSGTTGTGKSGTTGTGKSGTTGTGKSGTTGTGKSGTTGTGNSGTTGTGNSGTTGTGKSGTTGTGKSGTTGTGKSGTTGTGKSGTTGTGKSGTTGTGKSGTTGTGKSGTTGTGKSGNGKGKGKGSCIYENTVYEVGSVFRKKSDPCVQCTCCHNNKYTCDRQKCPALKCGVNMQVETENECCKKCMPACKAEWKKDCPNGVQCFGKSVVAYPKDKCCGKCGCRFQGFMNVPPGRIGHICDGKCHSNGDITHFTGKIPGCPEKPLECMNPVYDINCQYKCPGGVRSCRHGSTIIPYDSTVVIGNMFCKCYDGHFYTKAFCSTISSSGIPEHILQANRCVAIPEKIMESLPGLT